MTFIPASIRQQVIKRAGGRCEYCRRPDSSTPFGHHIDHVMPTKHGGSSDLNNLAYACVKCNTFKSSEVAVYDELTEALAPLFNPRTQHWDEHFQLIEAEIVGKTATGRITVRLLQMNHPNQLKIRRALIAAKIW